MDFQPLDNSRPIELHVVVGVVGKIESGMLLSSSSKNCNTTMPRQSDFKPLTSGQSYKHFIIVSYNSRVVITNKLLI